jgi:hypothetical protein
MADYQRVAYAVRCAGIMDPNLCPKTISAGDLPFFLGVFQDFSIPRANSSDVMSPWVEILVTGSFIAATAASAWPLLWG